MKHLGLELRRVYFDRLTGELTASFGQIEKNLFFDKGDLVFARTNQPGERLGEILFKLGKISEEVFLKIEEYIAPHQNLGQVLMKKGLVSERNLREGLIYQMKEITLNLFHVFEADFVFQENKTYQSPLGEEIRIPTPQLIEDGIRLMKIHPKLVNFLEEKIPFIKSKTFLHLLTEEERELLTKITGKTSSKALLKLSGLSSDHFWRTLYLFYCLDLVDFIGVETTWKKQEEEAKREAEVSEALNEVLEYHARIANLNFYEILGISRKASEEEIKKAYFHLARRFHPDHFGREIPSSVRDKINEVFDQITKAYKTLINPDSRRKYDLSLAGGETEARSVAARADTKFRQGKSLFQQGRFEEAVVLLEESVRLVPSKADYRLLLAMAEARIPALRKKAEFDFLKVQELEPWNAEAYVGLGLLYKEEGLVIKATKQFRKALEVDPDHKVARSELELLEGPKKKTSFFSLFKKK